MSQDHLTAVAYLRTSGHAKEALREQQARCEELAELVGARLVAIYADRGVPGTAPERPGLSCLLDQLRRERVDVVVTDGPERLARGRGLWSELSRRIEDSGASLLVTEPGNDEQAA
jgi:DNA invertase Pin-like site-specific DNA recombinase